MVTTTLKIIECLGESDFSSKALCEKFNISLATLKREISEARHLGAKIESYRSKNESLYRLKNWDACKKTTLRWIALQEKDSVL
jgi:predicted DNA-binding transcriptional regulator YafY